MRKVKKHVKKYFVPHKGNKYHPHIFRDFSVFTIIAVSVFFLGIIVGNKYFFTKTVLGANIATNILVDMANQTRSANKIPRLERNKKLDLAANYKLDDMVENKYFGHFSPGGTTPWYFFNRVGYIFLYAGENLAMDFLDSAAVQNAWLASPNHKANLLNKNYRDVGMATREVFYNGRETIFVVQMFGAESSISKGIDLHEDGHIKKEFLEDTRIAEEFINTINEDEKFISVENTSLTDKIKEEGTVAGVSTYSSVWQRLLYSLPMYLQILYFVLLLVVGLALGLRLFIEFKKQHKFHLTVSVLLFIFVSLVFALSLFTV